MKNKVLGAAALLAAFSFPGLASAATAIATANVNLRAGPSTSYPAVNVVPNGYDVEVHGCLSNRSWCDVSYGPQRGWMSSNYLAYVERGQRYTGPRVIQRIGAPVVTFSVGNYWDRHYRGRDFYRDRGRWERGPDWDRHERREARDRRNEREEFRERQRERERREEWRERERDRRADRREDRREFRRDERRGTGDREVIGRTSDGRIIVRGGRSD